MKKLLSALLSALCLLSCDSPRMVGAYGGYEKVGQQEESLFEEAVKAYDKNLVLKPKKVSRQVVAGTNYRFLCKDSRRKTCTVVIYVPLPGRGEPRVTSIE